MNKDQLIIYLCLGTLLASALGFVLKINSNQDKLAEAILDPLPHQSEIKTISTSLDGQREIKKPQIFIATYDLPIGSNVDGTMMDWQVPEPPKPPVLMLPPAPPKAVVVEKTEEELLKEKLLEQVKNNSSAKIDGQMYMLTEQQLLSLIGTAAKNNHSKMTEELKTIAENSARQTGEIQEIKSLIQEQSGQDEKIKKSTSWRTVDIE